MRFPGTILFGALCLLLACSLGLAASGAAARGGRGHPGLAHHGDRVTEIGGWPAGCWGFAKDGDTGYLGVGRHYLRRLDLSDPGSPGLLDELEVQGLVFDIEPAGETVYFTTVGEGLWAIGAGGSRAPELVQLLPLTGPTYGLELAGNHAFLTNSELGLVSVDISADPPVAVDSFFVPGAFDLRVSGATAFVTGGSGLYMFAVGNPAELDSIGHFPCAPGEGNQILAAVQGDYAYILHAGGLQILDVGNPSQPVERGALPGLRFAAWGLAVQDGHLYMTNGSCFQVVNVGDPDAPFVTGCADFGGAAHWGVAIVCDGPVAYCSNAARGLQVIDISTPSSPNLLGAHGMLGPCYKIAWRGDVAAVDAAGSLVLFDLSSPANPDTFAVVHVDQIGVPADELREMALHGDHLFLLYEHSLVAMDVSDPRLPELSDELITGFGENETLLIDPLRNLAIIAVGGRVLVADISNPNLLRPEGEAELYSGWPVRLAIDDQHLYVLTWCGLDVYELDELADKSGWLAPCGRWHQTPEGSPCHPEDLVIDVSSRRAYIADEGGLVRIIDIAEPCDPDSIGAYRVDAEVEGLAICELAGGGAGLMILNKVDLGAGTLYVLDASDASAPALAGWFGNLGGAEEVAAQGNLAIVTSATGVSVLRVESGTPVSLDFFAAERQGGRALLRWGVSLAREHAGFFLYREQPDGSRRRLHEEMLCGSRQYQFVDEAPPREAARYWLQEVGLDGARTWLRSASLAAAAAPAWGSPLGPVHPNPSPGQTTIEFRLREPGHARLAVYDVTGRLVATLLDAPRAAGVYRVSWDGCDPQGHRAPSGVYLARLEVAGVLAERRVLLSR